MARALCSSPRAQPYLGCDGVIALVHNLLAEPSLSRVQAPSDAKAHMGSRRLLKGGASFGRASSFSGGFGRSSTAIRSPWADARPRSMAYGLTARHVVMTGAAVTIIHNHHGYGRWNLPLPGVWDRRFERTSTTGRYYGNNDACYTASGCPVTVAEPLSRDVRCFPPLLPYSRVKHLLAL